MARRGSKHPMIKNITFVQTSSVDITPPKSAAKIIKSDLDLYHDDGTGLVEDPDIANWKKRPVRGEVISCGCCRGPENDRCCCHSHQDIARGSRAHKCSLHGG